MTDSKVSSDYLHIKLEDFSPNPYQPESRVQVSEETAEKFGLSILEHGLLQIPVCRMVDMGEGNIRYEMGDGWLRLSGFKWLTAHGHQGYDVMPVTLRGFSDQQMADLVMEANMVRKDLNPLELAWFYKKYLSDFPKVTQAEFARRHNKSQGEISNTMRLLDLPVYVQNLIISREISESHGRVLLQLDDKATISNLAEEAVDNGYNVVALDALVKRIIDLQKPKLVETPAPEEAEVEEEVVAEASPETVEAPPAEESLQEVSPESAEEVATETSQEVTTEMSIKPATPAAVKPAGKPVAPAPAAAPAPPQPNWGRKLVIEEKKDHVLASCMKAGGIPSFKKFENADFTDAIREAVEWVLDLEEEWSKEGK